MIVQILAPTNWNIHFIEQEIQGARGLLLNDDAENMNSKERNPTVMPSNGQPLND